MSPRRVIPGVSDGRPGCRHFWCDSLAGYLPRRPAVSAMNFTDGGRGSAGTALVLGTPQSERERRSYRGSPSSPDTELQHHGTDASRCLQIPHHGLARVRRLSMTERQPGSSLLRFNRGGRLLSGAAARDSLATPATPLSQAKAQVGARTTGGEPRAAANPSARHGRNAFLSRSNRGRSFSRPTQCALKGDPIVRGTTGDPTWG